MKKYCDRSTEAAQLHHNIFERDARDQVWTRPDQRDTFQFQEFGISAVSVLTDDILIKKLADETVSQGTSLDESIRTVVHLCYNWKLRLPFVVVERGVKNARSEYTPQYGRDDNYVTHTWTNTTYKIYTIEECEKNEPEVGQVLKQLD